MSSVPGNDGNTVEEKTNTERFSILRQCYDNKTQVLITCRGGKMKLRGRVKSYAEDCSLVLENLEEWIEEVPGKVSRKEFKTMKFVKGDTINSVIPTVCDEKQQAHFRAIQEKESAIQEKESTSK